MNQISWPEIINTVKQDFVAIAETHKAVTWREECEFALQSFNNNPKLAECAPFTVKSAIKNVAAVGLSLNPAYGFAYLVPEAKKRNDEWVQECQLRISFQGLIKLATDSGAIKVVKAEIVRENDTFEYNGPLEQPRHMIKTPFNQAQRGEPVGVYCIAVTHEDRVLVDLMPWDEVLKIKSKAKTQNVWETWTEEMAKKAIIKRASKQWPKTDQFERLQAAVSVLNESEGNATEGYTDEQSEKFFDYLENGSDIEFYGYIKHLPEQAFIDLYNSFPKGQKVSGKAKVAEKEKAGLRQLIKITGELSSDDDETREEALSGLTDIEKRIAIRFYENYTKWLKGTYNG